MPTSVAVFTVSTARLPAPGCPGNIAHKSGSDWDKGLHNTTQCTVYSVQCTLHTVHCTLNSVQSADYRGSANSRSSAGFKSFKGARMKDFRSELNKYWILPRLNFVAAVTAFQKTEILTTDLRWEAPRRSWWPCKVSSWSNMGAPKASALNTMLWKLFLDVLDNTGSLLGAP